MAAIVLFSVFVIGPIFTSLSIKEYFKYCWSYLYNLCFVICYTLPGVFTNTPYPNGVNGSLWTLPIEVDMYLVIPIMMTAVKLLKSKKVRVFIVALPAVVICILDLFLFENSHIHFGFLGRDYSGALHMLSFYYIGVLIKYIEMSSKKIYELIHTGLSLPFATVLLFFISTLRCELATAHACLLVVLPYTLLALGYAPSKYMQKFGQRRELTYGIYLCAFPIQQITETFLIKYQLQCDSNILAIVTFGFCIVSAIVLNILIEEPVNRFLKRLLKQIASFQPTSHTVKERI